jgi:TRAP-type C4-dicarboxylate transport system permease large subunit
VHHGPAYSAVKRADRLFPDGGGVSVASLFMAGYLPGILMGLSIMVVCAVIAKRRGYPVSERPTCAQAAKRFSTPCPACCW